MKEKKIDQCKSPAGQKNLQTCAQLHFPYYTCIQWDKFGNKEIRAAFSTFLSEKYSSVIINETWEI